MAIISELTQLTPTMTEGTIVKWLVEKGTMINTGDLIAEVETDKAVMELEAFDSGKLLEIVAPEGTKLSVGSPVAILGEDGEDIASLVSEAKSRLASAAKAAPAAPAAPKAEAKAAPAPVAAAPQPEPAAAPAQANAPLVSPPREARLRTDGRILASPLAKSIAASHGVDIRNVPGSGPEGRVTKKDVQDFIANPAAPGGIARVVKSDSINELSGMRKTIATRLQQSKSNIPHFYLNIEFDAEPMVNLRKAINDDLKKLNEGTDKKQSISLNDFVVKATARALSDVPEVNASWQGDHILQHGRIDIGIAVSIEGGLITPYVRNADQLSLQELSNEIKKLAGKARDRKLKPEEFMNGTFTISNLGMFGISNFSAIINEPEAAILAVGTVVEKAVVKNGEVVPGSTMTVTLSCYHRVVDGATGAKFLSVLKYYAEHPHLLLI